MEARESRVNYLQRDRNEQGRARLRQQRQQEQLERERPRSASPLRATTKHVTSPGSYRDSSLNGHSTSHCQKIDRNRSSGTISAIQTDAADINQQTKKLEREGQALLENHRYTFVLERTPEGGYRRPQCQAHCACICSTGYDREIDDDYRICVLRDTAPGQKRLYHVRCFNQMIDLPKVALSRFIPDGGLGGQGLMVRKWFEHRGCIDLEKIALYIDKYKIYEAEDSKYSRQYIPWYFQHKKCEVEFGLCACPPEPTVPQEPILTDYITSADEKRELWAVLTHPRAEEMCGSSLQCGLLAGSISIAPEKTVENGVAVGERDRIAEVLASQRH